MSSKDHSEGVILCLGLRYQEVDGLTNKLFDPSVFRYVLAQFVACSLVVWLYYIFLYSIHRHDYVWNHTSHELVAIWCKIKGLVVILLLEPVSFTSMDPWSVSLLALFLLIACVNLLSAIRLLWLLVFDFRSLCCSFGFRSKLDKICRGGSLMSLLHSRVFLYLRKRKL